MIHCLPVSLPRRCLSSGYKGQRPEMPDAIRAAIPRLHEILDAMAVPQIQVGTRFCWLVASPPSEMDAAQGCTRHAEHHGCVAAPHMACRHAAARAIEQHCRGADLAPQRTSAACMAQAGCALALHSVAAVHLRQVAEMVADDVVGTMAVREHPLDARCSLHCP